MGNSATAENSSVQSVDRALQILNILADRGECGVTEIAFELGIHKSTASRLLSELLTHELVEQINDRGRYRLGLGLVRLAGHVTASLEPVSGSRNITRALAAAVGETVNISVLDGNQVLYVDQVTGPTIVAMRSWIGNRVGTHCTSTGKALTAWLDEPARIAARPDRWIQYMPNTIMNAKDLERELANVRERGWALAVEEMEPGLVAIAAPLRDPYGEVVATLAVSGPAYRITPDRYEDIAQQVVEAARKLSGKVEF